MSVSGTTITTTVPIDCGSNALNCGALTCGSLVSSGSIQGGSVNVGTIFCNAINASGAINAGTNGVTCGSINCSSVSSTGQVTQPRYWVRLYRSATQALTNNTSTFIIWDTIETTFGGTSNWSVSVPLSAVAVPVNGLYEIAYEIIFQNNSTAYRLGWIEINSVSPGTTRRYAEHQGPAASISQTAFVGTEIIQLSAGDTVSIAANQASGGNLNLLGGTNQYCTLRIVRLSE